jgi:hypothetical protein
LCPFGLHCRLHQSLVHIHTQHTIHNTQCTTQNTQHTTYNIHRGHQNNIHEIHITMKKTNTTSRNT